MGLDSIEIMFDWIHSISDIVITAVITTMALVGIGSVPTKTAVENIPEITIEPSTYWVIVEKINIRNCPSLECDVLGQLLLNTPIELSLAGASEWAEIPWGGQTAYINKIGLGEKKVTGTTNFSEFVKIKQANQATAKNQLTQIPSATKGLTYEEAAIKIATDVTLPNAPLDVSVRQEIYDNWTAITKYYTSKRGKDSVQAVYDDILDAYISWKTPTQQTSSNSRFIECVNAFNKSSAPISPGMLSSCLGSDSNSSNYSGQNNYTPSYEYEYYDPLESTRSLLEEQRRKQLEDDLCTGIGKTYAFGSCF